MTVSYWTEYVMYEGSELELYFPLAVCVSYQGNRRKHCLVRAYVACDRANLTPKEGETFYQKCSVHSSLAKTHTSVA